VPVGALPDGNAAEGARNGEDGADAVELVDGGEVVLVDELAVPAGPLVVEVQDTVRETETLPGP
jgi:hypothetical protein